MGVIEAPALGDADKVRQARVLGLAEWLEERVANRGVVVGAHSVQVQHVHVVHAQPSEALIE